LDSRPDGWQLPQPIQEISGESTSDALAANVSVFRLARVMGTSVRMIERHYGALLDGAGADTADRLDALDIERDQATDEAEGRLVRALPWLA
jgi:hypothetical protein